MGRRNRRSVLFDGCWAHVISRVADKRYVFNGTEDFEKFRAILLESKKKFNYRIHHYCLMHTHFHLAVSMTDAALFSEGLKWVKWTYAKYFNYKEQRFGPLWRDRFKSLVIENERYLLACGRYIEGSPVEASIVTRIEDWPYSSGRYYATGQCDELVDSYCCDGEMAMVKANAESFFTEGYAIGINFA